MNWPLTPAVILKPKSNGNPVPPSVVKATSTANLLPAGKDAVVAFDAIIVVPLRRFRGDSRETVPNGTVTRTADGLNVRPSKPVPVTVPNTNVKPTVVGVANRVVKVIGNNNDIFTTGFCAILGVSPVGGNIKSIASIFRVSVVGKVTGKLRAPRFRVTIGIAGAIRLNGTKKLDVSKLIPATPILDACIAVAP